MTHPLRRTPQARVQEPRVSPRVSCSRCGLDLSRHNEEVARIGEPSYTGRNTGEAAPTKPKRVGTIDGPWTVERMREIVRGMAA